MNGMVPLSRRFSERLSGSRLPVVLDPFFRGITEELRDNQMVFFPGYTKHGEEHIVGILADLERLIPEQVWDNPELFTPADAACLMLSVLLHDLGMLLREPGFQLIILGLWPPGTAGGGVFGDRPWPELWKEFLEEARRFDATDLDLLWGPAPTLHEISERNGLPAARPVVRELPADPAQWTKYDRMLAGEFLRRHHPRLAQEFALWGLPGVDLPSPNALLRKHLPEHQSLAELAGLVARSHGMDLRRACAEVRQYFPRRRRPEGTAPVYLMVLLRIADYLQLKSDRAPHVLLQLEKPPSPLSLLEWSKHRAVRDIDWHTDDPQAILIELSAQDLTLSVHLQLARLFADLQRELDISGAVLREEYGNDPKQGALWLTKSRVESDFSSDTFLEVLPYVPQHTAFSAAGPELIDLLIKPLYGDRPEIGVRELIQNAVDAVRELRQYCTVHGPCMVETLNQSADVVVSFNPDPNGVWWCRVSDKGIGMTPDTVRRFFLRAGASFRWSAEWKDEFEREAGGSRVIRSGRFGIGAFAAFLLGDRLRVSSRHVRSLFGIRFEAALHEDPIVLHKVHDLAVGTTVEIALRESPGKGGWDPDRWDFFAFTDVTVARTWEGKVLRQQFEVPNPDEEPKTVGWRRFTTDQFPQVDFYYPDSWRFGRSGSATSVLFPELCCNGIIIGNMGKDRTNVVIPCPPPLRYPPVLSIVDPRAMLPIDLRRSEVRNLKQALPNLGKHLLIDLIASCLVKTPSDPASCEINTYWHPGLHGHRHEGKDTAFTAEGAFLADPGIIAYGPWRHLIVPGSLKEFLRLTGDTLVVPLSDPDYFDYIPMRYGYQDREPVNRSCRMIVHRDLGGNATKFPNRKYDRIQISEYLEVWSSPGVPVGSCFDLDSLAKAEHRWRYLGPTILAIEWFLERKEMQMPVPGSFAALWLELVGSALIAFDRQERFSRLGRRDLLEPYLKAWRREHSLSGASELS